MNDQDYDITTHEREKELANEIDDGQKETWIWEQHSDLVKEFVEEKRDDFKEYCEMRWRETHE